MEKNEAQISGFAVVKKAPTAWKKRFSKKHSSSLFVQILSSKRCANFFFLINRSRDIEVLVILRFGKMVRYNKIINKTRSTKNQENSAHHFVDDYLTNFLAKFLQDRIKPWRVLRVLGALRVCTGYHFF